MPEKNWRNKWNCHQVDCDWNRNRTFGSKVCDMNCENVLYNISQINTSLIADEVLKVVVMEIKKLQGEYKIINDGINEPYITGIKDEGLCSVDGLLDKIISNLSLNKENERNTKEGGIVDLETGQESDFCAYEVESKDDLCGKPQYKGGFCKRHYRKVYGDF